MVGERSWKNLLQISGRDLRPPPWSRKGQNQATDRGPAGERGLLARASLCPWACENQCLEQGLTGQGGGGRTKRVGTWGALLMSLVHREPVNMVMTVGNKADGILVGTDGRYSSMAAGFR